MAHGALRSTLYALPTTGLKLSIIRSTNGPMVLRIFLIKKGICAYFIAIHLKPR